MGSQSGEIRTGMDAWLHRKVWGLSLRSWVTGLFACIAAIASGIAIKLYYYPPVHLIVPSGLQYEYIPDGRYIHSLKIGNGSSFIVKIPHSENEAVLEIGELQLGADAKIAMIAESGENGEEGIPGRDAKEFNTQPGIGGENGKPGGRGSKGADAKRLVFFANRVKAIAPVHFNVRGGKGGNGGVGGNGGDGNRASRSMGVRGGNGGSAGDGGGSNDGGKGGELYLVIRNKDDIEDFLEATRINVCGGDAGTPGEPGTPGAGGRKRGGIVGNLRSQPAGDDGSSAGYSLYQGRQGAPGNAYLNGRLITENGLFPVAQDALAHRVH